ncbi:transcriptional regulator, LysR family protein [Oceanicola granulosus HTCC2516]|uniref:Transcriptional regulator, LysR family protein n=1 Tax=Oceanicola granulosus (strain ATCC BAA-861 / DSM 15982 / KCTC 12143 / HTCC2516) TaxID=314256 RepID=Q2CGE1_OCEGH|nr:LysR family transcriptional regulator [Oceanicola granulosus]EAR51777.1 transcriptional regulator, LysR family protein [Oceanicola granulosus HTCC2516]
MIASRRFLPTLPSLLALEALERLGSVTLAAGELALTPSAVSRQLKVLEGQLGVTLMHRKGQGLQLTPAAQDYARSVRETLQELARASLRLTSNPDGVSLNLAVLPAFGAHWLGPRLGRFRAENPDIRLNFGTRAVPFDLRRERFDAAMHFGHRDWHGVDYFDLAGESVIPVAAPGLLGAEPVTPARLLELPLLHLESRPGAWEDWLEAQGVAVTGLHGMLFDQFKTLAEAAAFGMGVALLPTFLADEEVARGRLVRVHETPSRSAGRYWLVWLSDRPMREPLRRLLDWLAAEREP